MSEKLYNLEALNALVDGNEQFRRTLIELFNQTTPPILEDIQESSLKNDWNALYLHLHKIKPTIDSLGIQKAKPLLTKMMEESKKEKFNPAIGEMVSQFCGILQETIEQLKMNEL